MTFTYILLFSKQCNFPNCDSFWLDGSK